MNFNAAMTTPVRGWCACIEDMIKKVPGADVDAQGNVTFQGKSVTKVRVNGRIFYGGDLKTATQNLPADAVQSLQMVKMITATRLTPTGTKKWLNQKSFQIST